MSHHRNYITLVNGIETSAISISDRGLSYGDGIFETMRIVNGKVPMLDLHAKRLMAGVRALDLGSRTRLTQDFRKQVTMVAEAFTGQVVLKYMLTRGQNSSGYQPPMHADCTTIVQVNDMPDWPAAWYRQGIQAIRCKHPLPVQSALAGIKHLNRLDQVMAAHELNGEQEGLMFDYDGRLIEGTKSNVFLLYKNRLLTPSLQRIGVAGTMRQFLIDHQSELGIAIEETEIDAVMLQHAQGLMVVNSVFGVWPVTLLDDQPMPRVGIVDVMQQLVQTKLGFHQYV